MSRTCHRTKLSKHILPCKRVLFPAGCHSDISGEHHSSAYPKNTITPRSTKPPTPHRLLPLLTHADHALQDADGKQVAPAEPGGWRGQQRQQHVQEHRHAERPLGGEQLGQPPAQDLSHQVAVEIRGQQDALDDGVPRERALSGGGESTARR